MHIHYLSITWSQSLTTNWPIWICLSSCPNNWCISTIYYSWLWWISLKVITVLRATIFSARCQFRMHFICAFLLDAILLSCLCGTISLPWRCCGLTCTRIQIFRTKLNFNKIEIRATTIAFLSATCSISIGFDLTFWSRSLLFDFRDAWCRTGIHWITWSK